MMMNARQEGETIGNESNLSPLHPEYKIVIIGGSGLLESELFSGYKKEVYGDIHYSVSGDIMFISRHTCVNNEYAQPHQIQQTKIWKFIKKANPVAVLAVCSVGSLKPETLPLGSIVLPTDWMNANFTPLHFHNDALAHVKPIMDQKIRETISSAIAKDHVTSEFLVHPKPNEDIVYVQTNGPRFETRAEIRLLKQFADVVGMTAADEAGLACELGIPYCMLCFVDNLAHGLSASDEHIATVSAFRKAQRKNLLLVERAVSLALKQLLKSMELSLSSDIPSFNCETLIRAKYVATVDANDLCITNGLVAIGSDGKIIGVHQASANDYPQYSPREIIELPDSLLLPGLINAHTHSSMVLMRGFGDDMKLTDWLVTKIWPAEAKCVSPEFVADGTRMAIEEMFISGTTCFLDMYFFPAEIEKVSKEAGIRAVVGLVVIDFPSPMAKDGDDYIRQIREKLYCGC